MENIPAKIPQGTPTQKPSKWGLMAAVTAITLGCLLVGAIVGGSYMSWKLSQANYGTYGFALLVYPAGGAAGGFVRGLIIGSIWLVLKKRTRG